MTPSPSAPKCANWSRGCTGTRADFDEPLDETSTPGSSAYLEGQRAGALQQERKHAQRQERDAANSAKAEGRLGYQQAPNAGRMVRFEGGAPARAGGRNLRWDAAGLSGKSGKGQGDKRSRDKGGSPSAGGSGRYGQGRGGFGHSSY